MLSLLSLFLFFASAHCSAVPFSVNYPSATPTINYIDDVNFEWASWYDDTEVGVFCNQGNKSLILQSPTTKGSIITTTTVVHTLGAYLATESGISFPATCNVSMWSVSGTSIARTTTGGNFVITSDAGQAPVLYAAATTSTGSIPSSISSSVSSTSSSSISSSGASSGSQVTQSSTTSPTLTPHGSGLGTGAKAGIAIGAIFGAAIIGGLSVWLCIMRRRMEIQKQRLEAAEKAGKEKPELSGQPAGGMFCSGTGDIELEGTAKHEMFTESGRAGVHGSGYHAVAAQELP